MAKVILPSTLKSLAGGASEIEVDGTTTGEILRQLETLHPSIRGWVLDEQSHLRRHVNVFVNSRRAGLETPTQSRDEVQIIQSISGGSGKGDSSNEGDGQLELLVSTKKGLFVLTGKRGGEVKVGPRLFAGQTVEYASRDPRTGRYFASVTHGQFGPRIFYADAPNDDWKQADWKQADGPTFPKDTEKTVERVWAIEPGEADGVLWAGVAPAALFQSTDHGESWQLNRGLWNVPGREAWEGGLGGLCLHSICPWPGDPQRLAIGISAAGVWITSDGGESWRRGGRGLVPRYLPEEAREDATMLCVHNMTSRCCDKPSATMAKAPLASTSGLNRAKSSVPSMAAKAGQHWRPICRRSTQCDTPNPSGKNLGILLPFDSRVNRPDLIALFLRIRCCRFEPGRA